MRTRVASILVIAGMLLLWVMTWSSVPKQSKTSLDEKAFAKPEMKISTANVPLREVMSLLPNNRSWAGFLAEQGAETEGYIDPRSGTPSSIMLSVPLIPGNGKNNRLTLDELARTIGRPVSEVEPGVVKEAVKKFILKNREVLGIDVDQLGEIQATQVTDELWQIHIPQQVKGVPVRFGRVGATLSHGNLVLLGTEMWGNARINTHPRIDAAKAEQIGFDYVGGRLPEDTKWMEPTLVIVPIAPAGRESATRPGGRPGDGYQHRLVWAFGFERPLDAGRWEVMVDAHSGEVVALQDTNYYPTRKIKGGVYPITNTGICQSPYRCGEMQSFTPMPFVDYSPGSYANSAGVFDFAGTATTTLNGKYIGITDLCGSISESSASGDIDLGGTNGQHGCAVPPGHSAGDTSSSRTVTYEMNKIAEMARGWLPNNTWIRGQPQPLRVRVNRPISLFQCNAAWDGTEIWSGKGGFVCDQTCCAACLPDALCNQCGAGCCEECCHECGDLGEISTIMDHEWGHGLDANDANLTMSNTSEAYADIAAMYRTQTSCSGYGFRTSFWTDDEGCGLTLDGTGFNGKANQVDGIHCFTDCSGLREADYAKHLPATPDTPQNLVCGSCLTPGSGRVGPCGREEHCEAAPITQSAWDLATRDLQSAPFSFSSVTAFNLANRLFYLGSGNVLAWHACDCNAGTSDGCGANSGYNQWLAADDDNGNLADGTPHMTAIYAAFSRHNIACSTPARQNGGCAAGPSTATNLTVKPGALQARLTWNSVPGASKYWVFRTEGQAGCSMGRAIIATPATIAYTDTEVADGRRYYYSVMAVGSSDACSGPSSACRCATVHSGTPPPDVVASSDYQTGPGIIYQGSYWDTQVEDGVFEILQETVQGGISRLSHTWKFTNVPDGCLLLNYAADRVKGTDNDDFKFSWAPDVGGVPGAFEDIPGAVVMKPFHLIGGVTMSFGGPGAGSTVYIRIQDTNQTSGSSLDKVSVDRIAVLPQ